MSDDPQPSNPPIFGSAGIARSGAPSSGKMPCISCGHTIDSWDTFCRYCGKRQAKAAAWYYDPVWILLLGFLVLGPFALPLVWKSPKLSPAMRAILGTVLGVYSLFVVYACWEVFALTYNLMSQLSQGLQM